ncbi:MAG: SprT family zinc-dependent metalloprotease [Lysobacterales bacterium]
MTEIIHLGDLAITLVRKDVKHVHLSVHPPAGHVTLVAPASTRVDVARAYAASKLGWIREQQAALRAQARETPRRYVSRESHYLWGRRHLLTVVEINEKPKVTLDHRRIRLQIRPGMSEAARDAVMHEWHLSLLHKVLPGLITKWEANLGVSVARFYMQRMKTRWGSCNPSARTIRINTELVRKPKDLLEYVVVHEMAHLIEPTHNDQFVALLDRHYPQWREARAELNQLPLAAQSWKE